MSEQPEKCQRCGKPGEPAQGAAIYGEPLPFDIRAMDTGREERFWLCTDCYMWASEQLRTRGSVTVISK